MINIIYKLLVIPNIPLMFILVVLFSPTYGDDVSEYIAEIYPEWLYIIIGVLGWIWIINLIL